jgi:transposase
VGSRIGGEVSRTKNRRLPGAIEGALAFALRQHPHLVLFPINPAQSDSYRSSFSPSGKKNDVDDAELLAHYVREHHRVLRSWRPDDETTRKLGRCVELRRKFVEQRKQALQTITSLLKLYFPLALALAKEYSLKLMFALLERGATLRAWQPMNPRSLQQLLGRFFKNEDYITKLIQRIRAARPLTTDSAVIEPNALAVSRLLEVLPHLEKTIAEFDRDIAELMSRHPDAELFTSPSGAGEALAPRLLVAFGSDRERFQSAEEVECYSGIAPVTNQSGKSCHVHRRFACNKFLRQSFHEFADHARKHSAWSKAFYDH